MTAPIFGPNDRPAEVLHGAGHWLAASLPGFRWVKSRGDLDRKVGPQLHRIGLQSSTWSRSGIGTWVSPRLMVLDDRLRQWRKENPELSTAPDSDPRVFNSLFTNFMPGWSEFEASGLPQPAGMPTTRGLEAFLQCLTDEVLPALDAFAAPPTLVAGLPGRWWDLVDAQTVEWALACDDRASAVALIHRRMERPVRVGETAADRRYQFEKGWDAAGRREEPALPFSLSALGWLSAVHRLVEPNEIGPPEGR